MAFWSSLGKALLKAAPVAASFIPGIGPLAAMGIGAAAGGAEGAMGGGGLKGALLGAGMGAGTGAIPIKGIGPTTGMRERIFRGIPAIAGAIGGYGNEEEEEAPARIPTKMMSRNNPYLTGGFAGGPNPLNMRGYPNIMGRGNYGVGGPIFNDPRYTGIAGPNRGNLGIGAYERFRTPPFVPQQGGDFWGRLLGGSLGGLLNRNKRPQGLRPY